MQALGKGHRGWGAGAGESEMFVRHYVEWREGERGLDGDGDGGASLGVNSIEGIGCLEIG